MGGKFFATTSILVLLTISSLLTSCGDQPKQNADDAYLKTINEWDTKRAENLKKKTGWLNLAGLFWLKEGANKFGSAENNDIIFPEGKAAGEIGVIVLQDEKVIIKINEGVTVTVNGEPVNEIEAVTDLEEITTIFDHKNLSWYIIVREGGPGNDNKIGIRLRDYDSETLKNFTKIDRFPVDTSWIIKGKYIKFPEPKNIIVPNIIGTFSEVEAEGEVVFSRDGEKYSIVPTSGGDGFFFVIADLTSGEETYGAGRFLYTEGADEEGNVILDFNKAYNPPCAFTKYATCPLPPKENHLKLAVTAGEKNWGNH